MSSSSKPKKASKVASEKVTRYGIIAFVLDSETSLTIPEAWGRTRALGPTTRTGSLTLYRG